MFTFKTLLLKRSKRQLFLKRLTLNFIFKSSDFSFSLQNHKEERKDLLKIFKKVDRKTKTFQTFKQYLCFQNRRILEKLWAESDLNQRRRTPADLQSAPVDHFGIGPFFPFYSFLHSWF